MGPPSLPPNGQTPHMVLGGLQSRLIALVALTLAVPLALTAWLLERQNQARSLAVAEEMLEAAHSVARSQADILAQAEALLNALAQMAHLWRDKDDCQEMLRDMVASAHWSRAIAVTDAAGRITCADDPDAVGMDLSDRAYLHDAVARRGIVVSGLLNSRGRLNQPVIVVARPIVEEGQPVSVLVTAVDIAALAQLMERDRTIANADTAVVLDGSGVLMARRPELPGLVGQDVSSHPLAALILDRGEGTTLQAGFDGHRRFFGFTRLPRTNAVLAVGRDASRVLGPAQRDALIAYGVLLGSMVTAVLLALWFGKAVLLRGLGRMAEAARDGKPLSGIELDPLVATEVAALHESLVENERQRIASERRWRTLGESGAQIVWRAAPDGSILEGLDPANPAPWTERLHPADLGIVMASWGARLADGEPLDLEHRLAVAGPQAWRWVRNHAVAVRDPRSGTVQEWVGTLQDVDDRRRAEALFRVLAENSGDVVMLNDREGRRLYVSPAAERVLGWRPEALLGRSGLDFVHPEDRAGLDAALSTMRDGSTETTATYRHARPDGSWIWVDGRARVHRQDGEVAGSVVQLRDASARKAEEARLTASFAGMKAMAETDPLTGLANRRHFDQALVEAWRACAREGKPISLLLADADRFKLFNDRYGHQAGDDCLRMVAGALRDTARRAGDLAARLGGEEFIVMLPHADSPGAAKAGEALRRRVEAVGLRHEANPPYGVVTISLGIATAWPEVGDRGIPALLAAADAAMYRAKNDGRNRIASAGDDADPLALAAEAAETPASH